MNANNLEKAYDLLKSRVIMVEQVKALRILVNETFEQQKTFALLMKPDGPKESIDKGATPISVTTGQGQSFEYIIDSLNNIFDPRSSIGHFMKENKPFSFGSCSGSNKKDPKITMDLDNMESVLVMQLVLDLKMKRLEQINKELEELGVNLKSEA